jgi:hypothetical protein
MLTAKGTVGPLAPTRPRIVNLDAFLGMDLPGASVTVDPIDPSISVVSTSSR